MEFDSSDELRHFAFWSSSDFRPPATYSEKMRLVFCGPFSSFIIIVSPIRLFILWRVEPLLCNDRVICRYTRVVSTQWLVKHVPAATNTHATIEVLLHYNNGNGVLLHGPC
jgi:hypothetical protein